MGELEKLATTEAKVWEANSYYDDAERWLYLFWDDDRPFRRLFNELDLANVLELACGYGRHSEYVTKHLPFGHYIGQDILESNVVHCKNRINSPRAIFQLNAGTNFQPAEDQSVSSIYCYDAMVHFDRRVVQSYLNDASRVLARGGKVLLHHSNFSDSETVFAQNPHARAYMTRDVFNGYAKAAGLRLLKQETIQWGEVPELDCLSLLEKPSV